MAATAFVLSQRVYPIPLEWGRLARLALAATGAWLLATLLPASMPPLAGLLARGAIVVRGVSRAACSRSASTTGVSCGRWAAWSRGPHASHNVPEAPAALDGPIEAGGAILEVPLVQDDLLDDEIVLARRARRSRPARADRTVAS